MNYHHYLQDTSGQLAGIWVLAVPEKLAKLPNAPPTYKNQPPQKQNFKNFQINSVFLFVLTLRSLLIPTNL